MPLRIISLEGPKARLGELKQKQAQAKQEKKNEESVNYFLADNKTTWFSKLIEKMKGRGK